MRRRSSSVLGYSAAVSSLTRSMSADGCVSCGDASAEWVGVGGRSWGWLTVAGDALLIVVDGNGVVVRWSHQAEELTGCTAEDVVGQPVAHLVTRVAAGAG